MLVTTLSAYDADSYVTVAEADVYFENHFLLAKQTAWAALSDEQKERALRTARTTLENLPLEDHVVFRLVYRQGVVFPRNVDLDPETGEPYIPQDAKDGQCEQAIYLLSVDDAALATQMVGVRSESIGGGVSISTTYSGQGSLIAPMALDHMQRFLRTSRRLRRA